MASRRLASRTRPHTRPIRFTLAGLLIIPLVSLVALWGFATSVTLADTIAKRNYDTSTAKTGGQSQTLLVQLVQERLQSFVWLGSGRQSSHGPLELQRERTDTAVAAFRKGAAAVRGLLSTAAKQNLASLLGRLGQLGGTRDAIDSGAMKGAAAFEEYNSIIDAEFQFLDSQAATSDVSLYQRARANIDANRALEMVGREGALVGEAIAGGGHMSGTDHNLFVSAVANQRFLESGVLAQLSSRLAGPYRQLFASPTYRTWQAMEDAIASSSRPSAPLPVNSAAWQSQLQPFLMAFNHAAALGQREVNQSVSNIGRGILLRLALAGGVGLLAVLASILLLVRFGRRLTRELGGLHGQARELADMRLPQVVDALRRGEEVDVTAAAPPLTSGTVTEVANVAQAFSSVHRTAIEAAVGQARLRTRVNQVFVNLARRNQSLLHRQLDMLDSMERDTSDPQTLENFFRLDHLTTRMRRHAESLIILSGEVPGRGWRSPVRVVDVVRAAVAEVLDYPRVDVITESRDGVVGTAVANVIHLLAELIDNATAFSPPNTRVTVTAGRAANGFVLEVEDRGLGIESAELAEINKRLTSPPEFELADSDRLGLLVVGQLAARHRIKVALRESPFGGTSAVVLMPHSMVVPDRDIDDQADTQAAVSVAERPTLADAARQDWAAPDWAAPDWAAPDWAASAPAARQEAEPAGTGWAPATRRAPGSGGSPEGNGSATEEPAGGKEGATEDARTVMASLQQGWERGRADVSDGDISDTPEVGAEVEGGDT